MKKFLRTGKKTLSVFMAVLMAFTALVFVAPETVSAVNTGKYYVRVTCYNDNAKDAKGSYTAPWQDKNGGYSVNGNYKSAKNSNGKTKYNSGGGYTIFYKNAAGTETWSNSTVVDLETFIYKDYGYEGEKKTFVTACEGFPTKIQYYNSESDGFSAYISEWHIQKIEVASKADMSNAQTLWSGNFGVDSKSSAYVGYIYLDTDGKVKMVDPKDGITGSWETETDSGYGRTWVSPKPTKIDWVSASAANLTISTGSNTVNRAFKFNVLDQYGVVMSTKDLTAANATPTVNISAENFGTVSTSTDANLYYSLTNSADNNTATIYAKPALKSLEKGVNSYKVTVTASAGSTDIKDSKTFTIYDPKYTVYFDANGGDALNPVSTQVYYGESLASQAELDGTSNYPTSGTYAGHSFLGLFDAKTGGTAMDPNAAVTASKTYYAQWDENTYVVVFLDKDGKCVDVQYVPYDDNADGAAAAEKLDAAKPDADKHYTFKTWDRDISNVSANMIVNAVYDKEAHTFGAETPVDANCQHGAGKERTCTVCGYKEITETSSVKGDHTLTGLIQDVAPTCTEEGKGHKECTVCGEKLEADTPIPALGHSYKISVTQEATCTAEGTRNLTCTRCGAEETESIPKTQHNYVKAETVTATCNSSGYDVMRCSVCGDEYKKYLGAASNDHIWSESYDKTTGVLTLTCSVCETVKTVDIGANLTDFVRATVTTQPTCKADGVVTVTAGDDTFTVTIKKETIPHNYKTEVTPATCTADGKIVNVCSVCGDRDEANAKVISKLGHYLEEKITKEATCLAAGEKTISCKRDGCDYSTTEAIPATGHKAVSVVANCTSGGTVTCSICGTKLAEIPAKDHDYSGAVREVVATCSTNGIKYTKCATCNAEKAELLPKLEHSYSDNWVTVVPAGCTTKGVEKRICNNDCGAFEIRETASIRHNTTTTETPATCTEAGSKVTRCDNVIGGVACDYEKTEIIQPLGHDLGEPVVHPQDCVSGAYEKRACQRKDCSYTEITFTGASSGLGHDFSKEVTVDGKTKAATCEEDGLKVMQCARCDKQQEVVLPKLGHNFDATDTVPASCTTSGYTVMKCNNTGCTKTYNEYDAEKPALGHDWGEWTIVTASTNTEKGKMNRSCKRTGCGATETAEIPAGGHSFVGAAGEVEIAATCHSKGETKYTCTAHTNCGVSITVETAETPHDLRTSITYAKCERIYNEDGTYEDVFTPGKIKVYCINSGCGYIDEPASIVLPISGHNWGEFQTQSEASCSKAGRKVRYCKNCGAADYVEIPATDHVFAAKVVAPTCEERGHTIYSCKSCDLTYRDDFTPSLGGHAYDEGTPVAATCTTPGRMLYTCTRIFKSEKVVDGKIVEVDVPCGHTKFVEDPEQPAYGHKFSDWKFVTHPKDGNAYAKWRECMNAGCTYSEYESGAGEEHEIEKINAYYKVNYYNEWATDTFETIETNKVYNGKQFSYTQLASTFKTEQLASIYVLKNTEAVYPGKTPKRDKTRQYGAYPFEGWTEQTGLTHFEKAIYDESAKLTNPIPDGIIAETSKITKNTDLYAVFRCADAYYQVTFFNRDGRQLSVIEHILHGHHAEYPFATPTYNPGDYFNYEFTGWSYDISKIYDDHLGVIAEYKVTPKEYTLVYYDWDGSVLGRETITYGGKAQNVPTVKGRAEDNTYIYAFLNTWVLQNNQTVDLNNFTGVTTATPEGSEIPVFAKYAQRKKVYIINFGINDPFDIPLGGATIKILDSKGQLVGTATTDSDGNASVEVNYSSVYSLTIARGNYWIEGTFTLDPFNPGTIAAAKVAGQNNTYQILARLNNNTDNPDSPEDRECKCICHTFLSGFWITILNLLYRVFKIRHVCCSDMFVVHGDKLLYKS